MKLALIFILSLASHAFAGPPTTELQGRGPVKRAGLNGFCSSFKASCRRVCVADKSGEVAVGYGCLMNSATGIYDFSCLCDGVEYGDAALDAASRPRTTVKTVSPTSTFAVTTKEVDQTRTVTQGGSTRTLTYTDASTIQLSAKTSTSRSTRTRTKTRTLNKTTVYTTLTSTPYTTYKVSDFEPTTITATATSYKGSISFKEKAHATATPLLRVAHKANGSASRVDSNHFCNAYSSACDRACKKVGSKKSKLTCERVSGDTLSAYYDLYCACTNGKVESLHALSDLNGDVSVTTLSVTVLSTLTTHLTVSDTSFIPSYTTTYSTTRSVIDYKPASTTQYTTFQTTVTRTTGLATGGTVSATKTKTRPPVEVTSVVGTGYYTETSYMTMSSEVVLAPTGNVRIINTDGFEFYPDCFDVSYEEEGYCSQLGWMQSTVNGTRVGLGDSRADATDVVLVRSPATKTETKDILYTLVDVATGDAIIPQGQKADLLYDASSNAKACALSELTKTRTIEEAEAEGRDFIYWSYLNANYQGGTGSNAFLASPAGGVEIGMVVQVPSKREDSYYMISQLLTLPKAAKGGSAIKASPKSVLSLGPDYFNCKLAAAAGSNETVVGVALLFVFAQ